MSYISVGNIGANALISIFHVLMVPMPENAEIIRRIVNKELDRTVREIIGRRLCGW